MTIFTTGDWADIIDDTQISFTKTYSSDKISNLLNTKSDVVSTGWDNDILIRDADGNPQSSGKQLSEYSPSDHEHPSTDINLSTINFWGILDWTVWNLQQLADFIDDNVWFWVDWTDWNSLLNGETNPTTEWVDGDFYLNTTTIELFWPKAGWAWAWSWVILKWLDGEWIVSSVIWGDNINVDISDPINPIINHNWDANQVNIPFLNDSWATLTKWTVIIANWTNSSWVLINVVKAKADIIDNIKWNLFIIKDDTLNTENWSAVQFGRITNMDTSAMSVWPLYVSPTVAWELTQTRPSFPNYVITMWGVASVWVAWVIWVNQTTFPEDTFNDFFDWSVRETFDFRVSSNWTTITGSLENSDWINDLTMVFSDWFTILDTTPTKTVVLTPWTDWSPQENYIYIPKDTKILTSSTAWFPVDEHAKIAFIVVRSALATQTDSALVNQNINDHIKKEWDNGHMLHITERLRLENPKWRSWVSSSANIVSNWTWTPDVVTLSNTSWVIFQLHNQVFPLLDMALWDPAHIVNDFTTAYKEVVDIGWEQVDALNQSLNNTSFSIVKWWIQNKTWETSHIMLNYPVGSYAFVSPQDAINDADNQSVYDIPASYTSVWFLMARYTFTLKNNEFTLVDTQDLRGKVPNTIAWGWGWGGWVTDWTALSDTPSSYIWQALKIPRVASGETLQEFIDLEIDALLDAKSDWSSIFLWAWTWTNDDWANNNNALWISALASNTSGQRNSAIWWQALNKNTSWSDNIALWLQTLYNSLIANKNIGIWTSALPHLTTWDNNIALWYAPWNGIVSMSNSILIWYLANVLATWQTNQIVIWDQAVGNGSNTVTIWNSSITNTYLEWDVETTWNFITWKAEYDAWVSWTAKTIDWNNGINQKLSLTWNCTFTLSNPKIWTTYILKLIQDATWTRTGAFPATVKTQGWTWITLTETASATDVVSLYWDWTSYYTNIWLNYS